MFKDFEMWTTISETRKLPEEHGDIFVIKIDRPTFGKITSKALNDPDLWSSGAQLYITTHESSAYIQTIDWRRAILKAWGDMAGCRASATANRRTPMTSCCFLLLLRERALWIINPDIRCRECRAVHQLSMACYCCLFLEPMLNLHCSAA